MADMPHLCAEATRSRYFREAVRKIVSPMRGKSEQSVNSPLSDGTFTIRSARSDLIAFTTARATASEDVLPTYHGTLLPVRSRSSS